MIQKTEVTKKRTVKTWVFGYDSKDEHEETVNIITIWFLFIPIYRRIEVLRSKINAKSN